MAGRTHGQHALPVTFGFKAAVWLDEMLRAIGEARGGTPDLHIVDMRDPKWTEQVLDLTEAELNVICTNLFLVCPGAVNHRWCHIYTDYLASFAHLFGCKKTIKTTPTTEIYNCFPLF